MPRKLSPDFMNDLLSGKLKNILDIIHKDNTLDLEIRDNYINIYYRGGNILKISYDKKKSYKYHFDQKYLKLYPKITKADLDNFINNRDWHSCFSQTKQIMDFYFSSQRKEEREFQQMIVRENNYSSISNGTDYFIIDIEYNNHKNARFDLVAVEWPSEASKRKLHKDYKPKLIVIEMKYGDHALSGDAGMVKHWNDYNQFISNKHDLDNFKFEMVKVFEQKRELGLIPCLSLKGNTKAITQFADDLELAFLIANHDPASTKLKTELKKFKGFAKAPKFITSNFMGYGIYIESILGLDDFLSKNTQGNLMKFKIHRGTKEIGGSCVEVWTENTRILLDFGMPLVNADKTQFDSRKLTNLTVAELIEKGVLFEIKGLYDDSEKPIDGVLISHAHQDHYGFSNYVHKNVKFYLGEATHSIIKINNIFTPQELVLDNTTYFKKEVPFQIGDFTITAYWADHSAFDAYSFLIEADGKRLFYSADFRSHGRKANVFKWFLHNAPQNVDYLLMEGTTLGRQSDERFKTEIEIQDELEQLFKVPDKINLIYTSGQNIDRLVSIYKACYNTGKTMVVDVYVAYVLNALSKFGIIPHPSDGYPNIKVIYTKYTSDRLRKTGNEKILYQFTNFKISKDEISNEPEKFVMLVRPGMEEDLKEIRNIEGGNLIYSMWEGYLESPATKKIIDYLEKRKFTMCKIHTSGHADTEALKQMVNAINPKFIVPIHTFNAGDYKNHFSQPVVELNDGDEQEI